MRLIGTLVLAPNLPFLLAMPFYVATRILSPFFYLIAGIAAYVLPAWCAYPVFAIAALLDLALIVVVAFRLPVAVAFDTLRFLSTIDIAASRFYIAFILTMIVVALVTAWLFNRYRRDVPKASPTGVAFALLAVVGLDACVNLPSLPQDPPFDSAVSQNDLTADVISASAHNMLLVTVEGLGAFADPEERSRLSGILQTVTKNGRYDLTSGTTRYSGSTTGAAARELCGHWGSYADFLGDRTYDCLPRRLKAKGFRTMSFHGYSGEMFFRYNWYPRIGFESSAFLEDMAARVPGLVPSRCGSVLKGLCDPEIAHVVHAALKADPDRRKFAYFLTLNTHIPYVPTTTGRLGCATITPAIANRTVCDLTDLWSDLFEALSRIAQDPDLPPTDILIVGDHPTPLWERAAMRHFAPGLVDWYMLHRQPTPAASEAASR